MSHWSIKYSMVSPSKFTGRNYFVLLCVWYCHATAQPSIGSTNMMPSYKVQFIVSIDLTVCILDVLLPSIVWPVLCYIDTVLNNNRGKNLYFLFRLPNPRVWHLLPSSRHSSLRVYFSSIFIIF